MVRLVRARLRPTTGWRPGRAWLNTEPVATAVRHAHAIQGRVLSLLLTTLRAPFSGGKQAVLEPGPETKSSNPPLTTAVGTFRGALIGLVLFSALINILYLTGSFYMLQVYDRVIPGRSVPTLIALSVLAATLYAGQATLDFFRGRILARVARSLDEQLSPRVFDLIACHPLTGRAGT